MHGALEHTRSRQHIRNISLVRLQGNDRRLPGHLHGHREHDDIVTIVCQCHIPRWGYGRSGGSIGRFLAVRLGKPSAYPPCNVLEKLLLILISSNS